MRLTSSFWRSPARASARSSHLLASSPTRCLPPRSRSRRDGSSSSGYCAPCHNDDAKGNGPLAPKDIHPPDLTDAEWVHGGTDGEIFSNIRNGIGPKFDMKSMRSRMTDTDIWNVVNYIRSLGPQAPTPKP